MVLDYAPGSFLIDTCNYAGALGEKAAHYIMNQIIEVLQYLHQSKGVVHRDLKLENMLVT